ncbi:unnamed protein product [Urochloa humidicola]
MAAQPPAYGGEDELMEEFRVFGADGDGRITAQELHAIMEVIVGGDYSLDNCRCMIGGVDSDGDSFVGFKDFARMMMIAAATDTCALL